MGEPVRKNGPDGIHAATVTGDTIGDPFKDTSGPSLNILMKLMTMISLVFAKEQFAGLKKYEKWWISLITGVLFLILAVGLTMWMRSKGMGKMPPMPAKSADEENELLPKSVHKTGGKSTTAVLPEEKDMEAQIA